MADTQYEFSLQSRSSQVRGPGDILFAARSFLQPTCRPFFIPSGRVISEYNNKMKMQGDYSTPITAVAETLSDYRATNVRAGMKSPAPSRLMLKRDV